MGDQKNLILAIVLSVAIILLFQLVIAPPQKPATPSGQPPTAQTTTPSATTPATPGPATPGTTPPATTPPGTQPPMPGTVPPAAPPRFTLREDLLKDSPRVAIDAKRLRGSISLKGALLDDITLRGYRESVEKGSANVHLLSPAAAGKGKAYYVLFGWQPAAGSKPVTLPDENTVWQAEGGPLGPGKPVTLTWTNPQGLKFSRRFEIDDNFLVTVQETVENTGSEPVQLAPYSLARLVGEPKTLGFFILHEGPIAVFRKTADSGATINDPSYKDIRETGVDQASLGGWLGFTDHYWFVALIPQQDKQQRVAYSYDKAADTYNAFYVGDARPIAPGGKTEAVHRVFAGAKEVDLLRRYGEEQKIEKFDWAIDFGWFWFFTKPFLFALKWIYGHVGNFGIAIMILTILVKLLFFPLANKSYKSMSQMKKLSPEIQRIRERYAQDKAMLNQELMKLYKKERINPAAGCLPIVVQIPVFFALYKVLFVAIEMRHAPFFGWIQDLSNKDPTSILNLFGLLPWAVPAAGSLFDMLNIGIWPLIMGGTMWLQHKLNPAPPDPIQAKVFAWMPVIFTVMLANFPAGLVIYWAWNNVLSIGQQWLIMKKSGAIGVHPDTSVPRNIKELEARKAAKAAAAAKEKAGG
ncbi:MAG TPA: membrane protein insertase YidC [Alphaproteobacteria bacterium]|jgi:YidC/Oxa1 family membrane protein insertase